MCEDDDAVMNYAAIYDDALMNLFTSMGVTFVDCETGIIEEGEHITKEDVPQ